MSWKNFAPGSCEKHRRYGKKKMCCCGGHSRNDTKKNKNHAATRTRLNIRKSRRIKHEEQALHLIGAFGDCCSPCFVDGDHYVP